MIEPHERSPRPYPSPPPATGPSTRLGGRALRRPEARFGASIAAGGAALVLAGVLVWSVGYLVDGLSSGGGSGHRFLGVLLSVALVAGGYALIVVRRSGALATAGVVLGAFGVPVLLLFLSFDTGNVAHGDLPFSVDAVYIVSIIAWAVSYFLVPGARGRAFFLGMAAVGVASYIAIKAAGNDPFVRTTVTISGGATPSPHAPGTGTFAAIGLVFGLGYYAIAAFLDHRRRSGAAIALVYAGFQLTVVGVVSAIPSFHQTGIGVLLIVLGAGLAWYGGRFGRRFTTWFWAAAFVLGVILLVAKIGLDSYTGVGITLIVVGAVVALGAHVFATATGEPAEIDEPAVVAGG